MLKGELNKFQRFYFIGAGGVSMSALAKIMLKNGKVVAGYDRSENEYTRYLADLGVKINHDCSADLTGYDCVVYTDAILPNNPLLTKARSMGVAMYNRGDFLAALCKEYGKVIAISGCHGKTTCSAMLSNIFYSSHLNFTSHIGGTDNNLSNAYMCGFDYMVTEACEYKHNFLKLSPDLGIILNTEADHLDCYGGEAELKRAYELFAAGSGSVICLYGDMNSGNCITFGFDDRADYYAKRIKNNGGKYSFCVFEHGAELGEIALNAYGKHSVLNALAAIAAARHFGIGFDSVKSGLLSFCGVKRRFENIGRLNNVACIADYAHHPSEIKAAIKTAKLITDGNVYVVFQPHTYSRTKSMFRQFVAALAPVKKLLVYKTYAAREYYDDAGSALTLSSALKKSVYADSPEDIVQFVCDARGSDVLLVLGAGDIYDIVKSLILNKK